MAEESAAVPASTMGSDSVQCENDEHFAGFSDVVKPRLQALLPLSDCSLCSCDGLRVPTHKYKLVEQSTVLRDMISEVHSGELRLSEDGPTLRLLIEGLYDANMAVSEENLEPLLELSRKYDAADLRLNCKRFLDAVPLTMQNLPRLLLLSCTYDVSSATTRCQQFVQIEGNFDQLVRKHDWRWVEVRPAVAVVHMLSKRLEAERASHHSDLEAKRASHQSDMSELRSQMLEYHRVRSEYRCLYNSANLTTKAEKRFKPWW